MVYNILLQTAINEIVEQIWDVEVLFVLSLKDHGDYLPVPLFLDRYSLVSLDYTDNGICLALYTPNQSVYEVSIPYHRIHEITGFYDNFNLKKTLYYCVILGRAGDIGNYI